MITNVITTEEEDLYDLEVRKYHSESIVMPDPTILPIDQWWAVLFQKGTFPVLSKVIKSILSCFHGPQVESSFSLMGDILDKKSSALTVETYSSIQSVKYQLMAAGKSAVGFFSKKDFLHDPPDRRLCSNMRSAYKTYQTILSKKKEAEKEKKTALDIAPPEEVLSKTKSKEVSKQLAKKIRVP